MKLPNLGQMVGPLPLGGWVAVVGGGLGLAYVARKRGGDEEEAEEPEPVDPFPATPATSGPTFLRPSLPAEPSAPPVTDNGEWVALAVRALVVKGYAPYTTQQCLQRFLEGVIQGEPCAGIVNAAIEAVGPPPTGAPVNQFPLRTPAPPVRPPLVQSPNVAKVTLCRTYRVRPSGGTWQNVDRAGYDRANGQAGARSSVGAGGKVEYHPCGRPNESRPREAWVPADRYTFR